MFMIMVLIISIPLTLFLIFITTLIYEKGYKSVHKQASQPLVKALSLVLYSLPFNIILALYLSGIILFFGNELQNWASISLPAILITLVFSVCAGTVFVLGPFISLINGHDREILLSMFHISSSFVETMVVFSAIVIGRFSFWFYKFNKTKLEPYPEEDNMTSINETAINNTSTPFYANSFVRRGVIIILHFAVIFTAVLITALGNIYLSFFGSNVLVYGVAPILAIYTAQLSAKAYIYNRVTVSKIVARAIFISVLIISFVFCYTVLTSLL